MSLLTEYCLRHGRAHTDEGGWTYRVWETENGNKAGWVCAGDRKIRLPEFTTQAIRDGRREYASDQVQSHRNGQLSREFVELYPNRVKSMIKDGVLTKQEVKNSKHVWKELKGWEKNKKIDADVLAK